VETALIKPTPKYGVLEADLDVVIWNAAADQPSREELHFTMLDALQASRKSGAYILTIESTLISGFQHLLNVSKL
jgi:hypothetical protein